MKSEVKSQELDRLCAGTILEHALGMPNRPSEDLSERSFRFASDTYDYCAALVQLRGLPCRVAYQLFDAASSIGANRAEAKSSYSDREFLSKNTICLKEANEARFWLRLAEDKSLGNGPTRRRLLQESNELVSIYVAIVRNLKAKAARETGSKKSDL